MEGIEKQWDQLSDKLSQREKSLQDALEVSKQYYDILEELSDWTADYGDQVEHLPIVPAQTDAIKQQKDKVQVSFYLLHNIV